MEVRRQRSALSQTSLQRQVDADIIFDVVAPEQSFYQRWAGDRLIVARWLRPRSSISPALTDDVTEMLAENTWISTRDSTLSWRCPGFLSFLREQGTVLLVIARRVFPYANRRYAQYSKNGWKYHPCRKALFYRLRCQVDRCRTLTSRRQARAF